jgi:hypothetical protein
MSAEVKVSRWHVSGTFNVSLESAVFACLSPRLYSQRIHVLFGYFGPLAVPGLLTALVIVYSPITSSVWISTSDQ